MRYPCEGNALPNQQGQPRGPDEDKDQRAQICELKEVKKTMCMCAVYALKSLPFVKTIKQHQTDAFGCIFTLPNACGDFTQGAKRG